MLRSFVCGQSLLTNQPGMTVTWEIVGPGGGSAGGAGMYAGRLDLTNILSSGQTYHAQLRFVKILMTHRRFDDTAAPNGGTWLIPYSTPRRHHRPIHDNRRTRTKIRHRTKAADRDADRLYFNQALEKDHTARPPIPVSKVQHWKLTPKCSGPFRRAMWMHLKQVPGSCRRSE